jgi:aspartate aminotransferase
VALAAQFLGTHHACKAVYIPNPTWGNHINIFSRAGMTVHKYRYYRAADRALDFDGLIADLTAAPEHAVVLLHACAHNPTGVDPTDEQWKVIAQVCKERKLFPVFDMAYQGFVSGDPDKDASAVRYFVADGFSALICQSFSKNLGLYNERVGCLTAVAQSTPVATAILSQLRVVVRSLWSNPSLHGGSVVATVLNSDALNKQWRQELFTMSERVLRMRKALYDALVECNAPGTWTHILNQRGLFTYSGLTPDQVRALEQDHHVFMLETGRMNMCGITPGNVHRIARAIRDVMEHQG